MLSDVNEQTLWEFHKLLVLAGGGEVHDEADVKWTYAREPRFDRIMGARFTNEAANERIAHVSAEFISRGASVCWLTGPSTTPEDLGWRLERCGFVRLANYLGMDIRLDALADAPREPDGCRVCTVRDESLLRDWAEVLATGFGLGTETKRNTCREPLSVGLEEDSALTHYLAYLNGTPASVCTVFRGSEAAGLYFVATAPWARRQGLATAIIYRALKEAERRGSDLAVLQASRNGARIYRKMGFVRRCKMTVHSLHVSGREADFSKSSE